MRKLIPLLLLFCLSTGFATERIYNYDINIDLQTDGSMLVTERIDLEIAGINIKRGIYRDFPVNYKDNKGIKYKVSFEVLEASLDGAPVTQALREKGRYMRLYLGSENHLIPHGRHTYVIKYRTNHQLGFFVEYDELYWNAIGPDWAFPIDKARVELNFPQSIAAEKIQTEFYTGKYGSQKQAAKSGSRQSGAWFETTAALAPGDGFTIVASFPKGIYIEPSKAEKIERLLRDNSAILAAVVGFIALLIFMYWAWNKVGRDPPAGTIFPRFEAPGGLSPAAVRYVQQMIFDDKAMSAAIISLAVKGYLRINNQKKEEYSLTKLSPAASAAKLSLGEKAVLAGLFAEQEEIELDNKQHAILAKSKGNLSIALKKEYKEKLFKTNQIYMLPAVGIFVLTFIAMLVLGPAPAYVFLILLVSGIIALIAFAWLLYSPTFAGRKVMDEIEGLKMYLQTAESGRLNRMQSPELTPEVFETFLPYAFALGVENQWSNSFKDVLARALVDPSAKSSNYQPGWYSGYLATGLFNQQDFVNNIGSKLGSQLSTAVTYSSMPPGSSSGAGGGGFSGGGGGGGGGGGW